MGQCKRLKVSSLLVADNPTYIRSIYMMLIHESHEFELRVETKWFSQFFSAAYVALKNCENRTLQNFISICSSNRLCPHINVIYRVFSIKRTRRLFKTWPQGPGVYLKPAFNRGPAFINEVKFSSFLGWCIISHSLRSVRSLSILFFVMTACTSKLKLC